MSSQTHRFAHLKIEVIDYVKSDLWPVTTCKLINTNWVMPLHKFIAPLVWNLVTFVTKIKRVVSIVDITFHFTFVHSLIDSKGGCISDKPIGLHAVCPLALCIGVRWSIWEYSRVSFWQKQMFCIHTIHISVKPF